MTKRVKRQWDWLDHLALPLSTAFMYAAWFYPLVAHFLIDPVVGFRAPVLLFVLLFCIVSGSLLAGRVAGKWAGFALASLGSVAVSLLSLLSIGLWTTNPDWWPAPLPDLLDDTPVLIASLVVVTGAAFVWWQGMRIGRTGYDSLYQSFAVGAIALLGALFLAHLVPLPVGLSPGRSPPLRLLISGIAPFSLLLFPVTVLAALILVGFGLLSGQGTSRLAEWTIPVGLLFLGLVSPVSLPVRALTGPLLLFTASGLLALTLDRIARTRRVQERRYGVSVRVPRHWLVTALGVVGSIVVLGVLCLWLLAPVLFSIDRLPWPHIDWTPDLGGASRARRGVRDLSPEEDRSPAFERFTTFVLLVGALLVVWLVVAKRSWLPRLFGGLAGAPRPLDLWAAAHERRESIFSWQLLWNQLWALLGRLRPARAVPAFVDPGALSDSRRLVRDLYQRVLARAIRLGHARQRGQTPLAYMHTLARLCPTERAALRTLTWSYMCARYGLWSLSPEQVRATQEAFVRIGAALDVAERRFRPLSSDPALPLF